MLYPAFVFGAYTSQSRLGDCERCMNWYPEPVEAPGAPWSSLLLPTPGQQTFLSVSDVGARALFAMNNRAHAVVGGKVHELFETQTSTSRGSVTQDNYPAQIAYNGAVGNQLLISSGTNAYSVNLTTNTLTQVLTGDATMVAMIDTYFLAFNIQTSRFRWSAINDGTSWDSLDFAARSIAPDPWRAMAVDDSRQIWLIGERTGEVWYDSGGDPPFTPIPGAVFGFGTPAPFSVKVVGDTMVWLSQTTDGDGIVVSARGYSPERVSNFAVETAIASYRRTSTISDAEALVYQEDGHTFYVLNFPTANASWAWDKTTNVWHERGTWNAAMSRYDIWSPRVHAYAFGKHLVGNRATGTIASMDLTYGSEADGSAIRRMRVPPPLWKDPNARRMFISRFQLHVEPGLGTATGQGVNPTVMLRSSTNAKTWNNERSATSGRMGAYGTRVFWTRLPSAPELWVPEITVSDPIPWRIAGAEVEGQGIARASSRAA